MSLTCQKPLDNKNGRQKLMRLKTQGQAQVFAVVAQVTARRSTLGSTQCLRGLLQSIEEHISIGESLHCG
jgi:hypothetical protein